VLLHGNAKSVQELQMALAARVGLIVIDNFDEIERLSLLLDRLAHAPVGTPPHATGPSPIGEEKMGEEGEHMRAKLDSRAYARVGAGVPQEVLPQGVLIRVTPNVYGDTHEKISTGQANSKFGFSMDDVPDAIERVRAIEGLELQGLHAHIGSQLFDLAPFARAAEALGAFGSFPVWDLGGGLGVAYTDEQQPPDVEEYVGAVVRAAHAHGLAADARLLIEPGRSLTANAGVTLYTVESVKRNVSTWVAVDGGMSDNLRPMLYGARYEAHLASRMSDVQGPHASEHGEADGSAGGGIVRCVLAGKHCESGDVIVSDALLADPRPGDVVVTPATGAYGFAMASNYNGVPRPPVVFCKDGNARVVVRRETLDDLLARDAR
jgi:diaminopimelate decarboxylase